MSNLTEKGKEIVTTTPKDIKEFNNAQANITTQSLKEILEIARLQVVFPKIRKDKSFKFIRSSKIVYLLISIY